MQNLFLFPELEQSFLPVKKLKTKALTWLEACRKDPDPKPLRTVFIPKARAATQAPGKGRVYMYAHSTILIMEGLGIPKVSAWSKNIKQPHIHSLRG